jgi:hypothetical protein
MQELLNIEQFCQKMVNKIKINEIETNYWYCWKVLDEWGFPSWRWFHNFEPYGGGDIEFWVIFVIVN